MTFKTEVIGDSFQVVIATMVNMAMSARDFVVSRRLIFMVQRTGVTLQTG